MPYLSALAEFRNAVRESARIQKCTDILKLCDAFRDDILPNLGVRLEDREGAASSIKLVSRETLLKEREAKKMAESQKLAAKEKKRKMAEAAAAALEAQRKINPKDMFLHETDKYSAFDERVRRFVLEIYTLRSHQMNLNCCFFSFTGHSNSGRQRRKNQQGLDKETGKVVYRTGEKV